MTRPLGLLILGLMAVVFVLDLSTPMGLAVPILYSVPVSILAIRTSVDSSLPLFFAGLVSTILTLVALVLAGPPGEHDFWIGNRVLALCAVWGVIVIALLQNWLDSS